MTKDAMLRSLFGLGILLFFLWFVFLSVVADSYLYIETGIRIAVSLFLTGLGVAFRYLSLRIRRLEQQVADLTAIVSRKTND